MADKLDIEAEVRALFEAKLREFAAFCRQEWQMSAKERAEMGLEWSEEYSAGYNAGITDGVDGALDHWLRDELDW
ncbi:MAG: hypothetical protein GYB50_03795 [Rhodobacteraceae bacterium]|nr:hypothetical protein [Paracoccaceae bacterium]